MEVSQKRVLFKGIKWIIIFILVIIVVRFAGRLYLEYEWNRIDISFINEYNGQMVFLDKKNSELLLIDENLQLYKTISLEEYKDPYNTRNLAYMFGGSDPYNVEKWDSINIYETDYSVNLTTRFYNNKLLYRITIEPFDLNNESVNSVSIDFVDSYGFILENISCLNWIIIHDNDRNQQYIESTGNIPITRGNYSELKGCKLKLHFPF